MSLLSPHQLPSGRRILVDSGEADDLQKRLTDGDPTWGWEGDPELTLTLAEDPDGNWWWEVWSMDTHNQPYRCVRGPENTRLNPNAILQLLVAADNRKSDPLGAIEANNAALRRDQERREDEQIEDLGDRLYSALRRDGAHRL